MEFDALEKLFIDLASPFDGLIADDLNSRGMEDTPDNRIALWKEFDERLVKDFGTTSLFAVMMKALVDWQIEQQAMHIQIMDS